MIGALVSWGPAALWAAVLFFLSELENASTLLPVAVPDKVVHLLLYAVLGGALGWGRLREGSRAGGAALVLGLLYAGFDEVHQGWVPGRTPSVGDFAADGIGLALGYAVFVAVLLPRRGGDRDRAPGGAGPSDEDR